MPSYGVSIKVPDRTIMDRITAGLRAGTYRDAVGVAGTRALMDHFAAKELDAASHKTADSLGARRSGLYAEFARATNHQATTSGVVLSIAHDALRQRLHGGTIRPVNAQLLTIPARTESYNRRASTLGITLEMLWGKNGPYALAAAEDHQRVLKRGKREGQLTAADEGATHGKGGVYYWLVKEVTQDADPTVLPKREVLLSAIRESLKDWADEFRQGG